MSAITGTCKLIYKVASGTNCVGGLTVGGRHGYVANEKLQGGASKSSCLQYKDEGGCACLTHL